MSAREVSRESEAKWVEVEVVREVRRVLREVRREVWCWRVCSGLLMFLEVCLGRDLVEGRCGAYGSIEKESLEEDEALDAERERGGVV